MDLGLDKANVREITAKAIEIMIILGSRIKDELERIIGTKSIEASPCLKCRQRYLGERWAHPF